MLTTIKIREIIAESGKTTVSQIMNYFKIQYSGQYDPKQLRKNAKEIVTEMKSYL